MDGLKNREHRDSIYGFRGMVLARQFWPESSFARFAGSLLPKRVSLHPYNYIIHTHTHTHARARARARVCVCVIMIHVIE